jgi:hypothetical protein
MRSLDRSWRDTLSVDHFVGSASACSDINLTGAQRVYSQILSRISWGSRNKGDSTESRLTIGTSDPIGVTYKRSFLSSQYPSRPRKCAGVLIPSILSRRDGIGESTKTLQSRLR